MAKGTLSKEKITSALLKIFPGSFVDTDGKTIRIPTTCEGDLIQIKVALTAAKDVAVVENSMTDMSFSTIQPQNKELTQEEIDEVRALIADLGL